MQAQDNGIDVRNLQAENEILRLHNRMLREELAMAKVALKASEGTRHQAFNELAIYKVGSK